MVGGAAVELRWRQFGHAHLNRHLADQTALVYSIWIWESPKKQDGCRMAIDGGRSAWAPEGGMGFDGSDRALPFCRRGSVAGPYGPMSLRSEPHNSTAAAAGAVHAITVDAETPVWGDNRSYTRACGRRT